jgi:serine/threonine protein kinase
LHEECRDCIVHCDIKPENILLDDNFSAKVSDFGLSKLMDQKVHCKRSLTSVRGTGGYLAPEWLANLPITSKSDVFSYGMVLLEIISGRRNSDTLTSRRKKFSVWAFEEFESGNILNITDEKLGIDVNIDQVKRALLVSFWCIQEQPSQRPTMGKVVQMLQGILPIDKPPAPKSLETFQRSTSGSAREMEISVLATSSHPVSSISSVNRLSSRR